VKFVATAHCVAGKFTTHALKLAGCMVGRPVEQFTPPVKGQTRIADCSSSSSSSSKMSYLLGEARSKTPSVAAAADQRSHRIYVFIFIHRKVTNNINKVN